MHRSRGHGAIICDVPYPPACCGVPCDATCPPAIYVRLFPAVLVATAIVRQGSFSASGPTGWAAAPHFPNSSKRERVVSIAAKFEIEYLQYLDAEGKQVRKDLPAFAKDLDHMVELY